MESLETYNIANNKAFQDIWKDACTNGFRNFFIYQNEKDFHRYIPEEVYGVFDYHGNFVGDMLETDFIHFFNDDTIISIDEYLSYNHTRDKAEDYPIDIGNYFVNKDRMDVIPYIKKKRTIIVIVENLEKYE